MDRNILRIVLCDEDQNQFIRRSFDELMNVKSMNGEYPLVSVVMPTLNGLKLLKVSIPALLRTKYPNLEVIVVDNASTDGSVDFLTREHPEVSVIRLKENRGIVIPYNLGTASARGSLVSFVNNDMEVEPNWLLPLVQAMQSDESVACCDPKYLNYFARDRIDPSGGAGKFLDRYGNAVNRGGGEVDKGRYNTLQEVFYGLLLFRKDLLVKIGGFDESYFGWFDETDVCWRLHRLGYKVLYVPESIVYHMGSASSTQKGPKKKPKKFLVFHYYKNKLRTIIKNQFGALLVKSVLVYLFDLCGTSIYWLLTDDQEDIPVLIKALFWNVRNLKDTLQTRYSFKGKSADFKKLFAPYSGIWKLLISLLAKKSMERARGGFN